MNQWKQLRTVETWIDRNVANCLWEIQIRIVFTVYNRCRYFQYKYFTQTSEELIYKWES